VIVALVPDDGDQLGQGRGQQVDGVLGEMRVGDVTLHALDAQLARERAPATVLDHVAHLFDRGGLAHDAGVQALALLLQPLADLDGAVDGGAFFIAGDEEGDAAGVIRVAAHEGLGGHHHGRQRRLHVGGATAVQQAITVGGHEGRRGPLIERPRGHHVGVACKSQHGRRVVATALDGPEVGHRGVGRAKHQGVAFEAQGLQTVHHHLLAARVGGRHRRLSDQGLSEAQGIGHQVCVGCLSGRNCLGPGGARPG